VAEVTPADRRERDALLATKLHVPRPRPGLVSRPRLADLLDEGVDRGLALVAAPAGYGKSVLLSEWARRRTEPLAWLCVDAGDNDPVRFWRHVLAALDPARPGMAERVGALAGPPPPPAYDAQTRRPQPDRGGRSRPRARADRLARHRNRPRWVPGAEYHAPFGSKRI
jgi:hypothetical protein